MRTRLPNGFGLVEVIVALALFVLAATTGAVTVLGSFSLNRLGREETEASRLAAQGIEAARSIKNRGWTSPFLATNCAGGCGISASGGVWVWSGTNNVLGDYTRTVTVSPAQRNNSGDGDIVTSGGTNDPDTRQVTSEVTWDFSPTRSNSLSLTTYFTNFRKVISSDWTQPQLLGSLELTGAANGQAIAYRSGYVFLGRVSSGNAELYSINVSTPATPTSCGVNCERELGGNVNDIEISGSYAFIANGNNSEELQIIDISSPTTISSASLTIFDLTAGNSGNANNDALSLAISGTNLYMTRAGGSNDILRFDISTPTSPSLSAASNVIVGIPTDIAIVGNYAYVTSDDNNNELQVVELSTLNQVGSFNLDSGNNNANALSVTAAGSSHLLVGRTGSGAPEVYSIDISTPTSPSLASTLEVGNDITDIGYGNNLIFLATNDNGADLKIVNGSNLSSLPTFPPMGELNIGNSPLVMYYESTLDELYIASSDDAAELVIAQGQ